MICGARVGLAYAMTIASGASCPNLRDASVTVKSPVLESGSSNAAVTSSEAPLCLWPTTVRRRQVSSHINEHDNDARDLPAILALRVYLRLAIASSSRDDHLVSCKSGYLASKSLSSCSRSAVDADDSGACAGAGTVVEEVESGRDEIRGVRSVWLHVHHLLTVDRALVEPYMARSGVYQAASNEGRVTRLRTRSAPRLPLAHVMAPAVDVDELTSYFEQCGLAPKAANETARGKQALNAKELFSTNNLHTRNLNNKQALLALQLVKDGVKLSEASKSYTLEAISNQRLKGSDQVTGQYDPSTMRHNYG